MGGESIALTDRVVQLRLVQILGGRRIVQFFCALAIAMTSVMHLDVNFASVSGGLAFSATQDDDQTANDQIGLESCNFCSGTAAFQNVVTSADWEPVRQAIPSGPARRLATVSLPATAPPPRS